MFFAYISIFISKKCGIIKIPQLTSREIFMSILDFSTQINNGLMKNCLKQENLRVWQLSQNLAVK